MRVKRVVVVGGTHGNEYTGVYVLKRLGTASGQAKLIRPFPSLEIETLLASPRAVAANQRFIDKDLNRRFSLTTWQQEASDQSYEALRAREVHALLGPKFGDETANSRPRADLIVDLHTTTTKMHTTLIVADCDPLSMRCAAWVAARLGGEQAAWPVRVILGGADCGGTSDPLELVSLRSCGRCAVGVEVGPTPQGVLRADCIQATEAALHSIFEFMEQHNQAVVSVPPTLQCYRAAGKLPWPVDADGFPLAVVHPNIQDNDFKPLRKGDPVFIGLDGNLILYDGSLGDDESVVAIFANEGGYYYTSSGVGIGVAVQTEVKLPPYVTAPPHRARL